jgi:hypothetical protein
MGAVSKSRSQTTRFTLHASKKPGFKPAEQAARIKPRVERQRNPGDSDEKNNQPTTWATESDMTDGLSPVSRARGFVVAAFPGFRWRSTLGFILTPASRVGTCVETMDESLDYFHMALTRLGMNHESAVFDRLLKTAPVT